jgi:hypothetical protein
MPAQAAQSNLDIIPDHKNEMKNEKVFEKEKIYFAITW